jgi:uncharacterized membrane protein YwzB
MNLLEMEQIAFALVLHVRVLALAFPALARVQVEVLIK